MISVCGSGGIKNNLDVAEEGSGYFVLQFAGKLYLLAVTW